VDLQRALPADLAFRAELMPTRRRELFSGM
jgi:hypothetical protein